MMKTIGRSEELRRMTNARSGEEEEMRTVIGRSRKRTRCEEEKRKSRG